MGLCPELNLIEKRHKGIRAPRVGQVLNLPIYGHRDPRGPDNNILIWVDENDHLHIRVLKTNRCYGFIHSRAEDGFVEIEAA